MATDAPTLHSKRHANAAAATPRDRMSTAKSSSATERAPKQLLHLVFGGELTDIDRVAFSDVAKLDVVGIFPNYAEAHKAWKAAAQRTVDQAQVRYFIVHMHRLLDPDAKL
jgi:hypothetical protein